MGSSVSNEEIIEPIVISNLERPEVSSSSVNPDNSISSNSNTLATLMHPIRIVPLVRISRRGAYRVVRLHRLVLC